MAGQSAVRVAGWVAFAALLLAADQYTKALVVEHLPFRAHVDVLPVLSWVHWRNDGAAFSFLTGAGGWQMVLFITLGVGFSLFLLFELWRLPRAERLQALAYALILGGALGNLVDRVRLGYVTDFILVHYQNWYFPAFNIADSAIFCGAVLWGVLIWREYRAAGAGEEGRV